jgi:hypothetical protein
MISTRALALLALAAPAAAFAQTSYSQARIVGAPVAVMTADVRACWDRHDSLADRKAFLDREKRDIDRDGAVIASESDRLAGELRTLVNTDAGAVAAHNARSDAHNRRVAAHNRRVADMNLAAATLNNDSADMAAYCNLRTSRWRDDAYVAANPLR